MHYPLQSWRTDPHLPCLAVKMLSARIRPGRLFWSILLTSVFLHGQAQPTAADPAPGLLPAGYLTTRGSQIVDIRNRPVRIASVGWPGGDGDGFVPIGLNAVNYRLTIDHIKALGFNTIRLPWCDLWVGQHASAMPMKTPRYVAVDFRYNPELQGLTALQVTDRIIEYSGSIGLKVVLDHHNSACQGGQQANGLWFDNHTSVEQFEQNWLDWTKRYKGNDTIIGFDLHNEPLETASWGGGGAKDWHAEAEKLGRKLQDIDHGPLIIIEGVYTFHPRPHMPDPGPEGNLQGVRDLPVVLNVPNKLVYSVHEYPPSTSDYVVNRDPAKLVPHMNRIWGFIVTDGIAPVWIGEMGSSLEGKDAGEREWAETMFDYMNGKLAAQGGPGFAGDQQGVSGSWWFWGHMDNWTPNGILANWNGTPRQAQYSLVRRMLMRSLEAPSEQP
jgi:endoglucanase